MDTKPSFFYLLLFSSLSARWMVFNWVPLWQTLDMCKFQDTAVIHNKNKNVIKTMFWTANDYETSIIVSSYKLWIILYSFLRLPHLNYSHGHYKSLNMITNGLGRRPNGSRLCRTSFFFLLLFFCVCGKCKWLSCRKCLLLDVHNWIHGVA